jgi:hypothetical protein
MLVREATGRLQTLRDFRDLLPGSSRSRGNTSFSGSGSVTGTNWELLTTLALPSKCVWFLINDSKSKKNFSASMGRTSMVRVFWLAALNAN